MNAQIDRLQDVQEELTMLRRSFSTLQLATVNPLGEPDASYAAYIEHEENYYVFISELASHTCNLLHNRRASVLFIENEANADHLFARKRLTYQCTAERVERNKAEFDTVLEQFTVKFGNLIDTLRGLRDFHLFRLTPKRGLYVAGFAKAYAMDSDDLGQLRHLRDRGHGKTIDSADVA